jgi:hypothetical protein
MAFGREEKRVYLKKFCQALKQFGSIFCHTVLYKTKGKICFKKLAVRLPGKSSIS